MSPGIRSVHMSEVQVSGNLINLYKHIQKAHKKDGRISQQLQPHFQSHTFSCFRPLIRSKEFHFSFFIWPPIFKSSEQMHLSVCLHTRSHPRSFIQSASTGIEGSFCLSTIFYLCLHNLWYIKNNLPRKDIFWENCTGFYYHIYINIKNKLHAKPGRKIPFHFLYTTLPFVFEIGWTIISFHFVQMLCTF